MLMEVEEAQLIEGASWHVGTWARGDTALKGGSIGRPDDWLGIYDRSINPGFRFPFEMLSPLGGRWRVGAPGPCAHG